MGDFVFNIAKGRAAEKVADDPTRLGVLLLQTIEADGFMRDRLSVSDLLTGSTEADFDNYIRQVYTATIFLDQVANRVSLSIQNPTWVGAGGSVNNTVLKLVTYYDEGDDTTRIPLTAHDFKGTTNGSTLVAEMSSEGFFRAS